MRIFKTRLNDCYIVEPQVFNDERGFFLETFNDIRYKEILNIKYSFVQDNHSHSAKNVLRGLHFQNKNPQGKLVRVINGEVFDVAVDLRKNSSTFGKWHGEYLSEFNKKQFWIPPGFAHGFLVTSDSADFEYKCTSYYDPNNEGCIRWDDPDLDIKWPMKNPVLSLKDSKGSNFRDLFDESC